MSTRRFCSRPSSVAFVATGRNSPYPDAARWSGGKWLVASISCSTDVARDVESSQFERNRDVLMGTLSVWPSMRRSMGKSCSARPSAASTVAASGFTVAPPLSKKKWSGMRSTKSLRRRITRTSSMFGFCAVMLWSTVARLSMLNATRGFVGICVFCDGGAPSTPGIRPSLPRGTTVSPVAPAKLWENAPRRRWSTCDAENITTKNANSSVMKSA